MTLIPLFTICVSMILGVLEVLIFPCPMKLSHGTYGHLGERKAWGQSSCSAIHLSVTPEVVFGVKDLAQGTICDALDTGTVSSSREAPGAITNAMKYG